MDTSEHNRFTAILKTLSPNDAQFIEDLVLKDSLTDLYNRRKFDADLEFNIETNRRYGTPFSLIIFDIDDFKGINDSYGHLTGDLALGLVSKVLHESIRSTDSAYRWGGDEFAILLPHTNYEGAIDVAIRLHYNISNTPSNNNISANPTLSIGIAQYDESTAGQFMDKADKALYIAKENGKNCIIGYPNLNPIETPYEAYQLPLPMSMPMPV